MKGNLENLSLTLLNTGLVSLDNNWNYDNVISPFFRIYYISEGEGQVFHNNQTFILEPGFLYLIPSYAYSRYTCKEYMKQYYISALEESSDGISIFINRSFLYKVKADNLSVEYFKKILELNPNRNIEKDDPKIYDNRDGLISYKKDNEKLSEAEYLETRGILMSLLARFINTKRYSPIRTQKITSISSIVNYIGEHLQEDLTIQHLADKCNLNVDYFSRQFKDVFEIRPNQYIQNKRIERAQLLLVTTTDSLKEISYKIGLQNVSYFSRIFKKIVGKSPLQFRKEQWKM